MCLTEISKGTKYSLVYSEMFYIYRIGYIQSHISAGQDTANMDRRTVLLNAGVRILSSEPKNIMGR